MSNLNKVTTVTVGKGLKANQKKAQESVLVLSNEVNEALQNSANELGKAEQHGNSASACITNSIGYAKPVFEKFDYAEWTQAIKNMNGMLVKSFDITVSTADDILTKNLVKALPFDKPKKVGKDSERMRENRADEKPFMHMGIAEIRTLIKKSADDSQALKILLSVLTKKEKSTVKDSEKVAKEFIKQQKLVISEFTKDASQEQLVGMVQYIQTIKN
tara:strand:- start:167 stop:817 length:651 start_codon:yes stop_codon:yes gene_type:complete